MKQLLVPHKMPVAMCNPISGRRRQLVLAAAAAAAHAPLAAWSQGLSARPVRFLLAQTPATTPDVIARLLAPRFSARWNQPFIVENRPGAAGAIGMEALAKALPDGHTMQIMPSSIVTLPHFFPKLTFDVLRSFQPVSLVGSNNFALAAHTSVPAHDAREFISYAKAHPGMHYASAGNGTSHHLFMEQLKISAALQMTHVPYKGSAPAFNDLLGGHVPVMFMPIHVAMDMAKDGRVRVLGGSMRRARRSIQTCRRRTSRVCATSTATRGSASAARPGCPPRWWRNTAPSFAPSSPSPSCATCLQSRA
jgi:tripartite-type tricarboxylate transporter receptor subunit TctC